MSTSHARRLHVAEPPAHWMPRPAVVVDCSALAALLFAEPEANESAAALTGKTMHAPSLLPYELASVADKKLRSGAERASVETALRDFDEQPIELHPVPALSAFALAARYGLSAYDAAYLWLAAELKAPLATLDRRLATAAKRHMADPT